jgi:DNA-binding SARP family transcriptional activator
MVERTFHLQLFATPELREGPPGGIVLLAAGKPLALLAYLAITAGPASRDDLAALLWPGADHSHARASVRHALWLLRNTLGDGAFDSEDPVQLREGDLLIDLDEFHRALSSGDLGLAGELWRGPPLLGLEFPRAPAWLEWAEGVRNQEETRFGVALSLAARSASDASAFEEATRWLLKAVEVQPYQLSHRTALIEALLSRHDYSEAEEAIAAALRVFEDGRSQEALDELKDRLARLRTEGIRIGDRRGIRTEFVGRTIEFSNLTSEWRRSRRGEPRVGLITGAPGIGKTRLAEELLPVAEMEGSTVVSVKAVEVERALDWGTTTDLVRTLHALPGAAGISNRSAAVLASLVPSLGLNGNILSASSGVSEPAAVADALLDLVGAVAEEKPLLILVDDLQWADKKSRAALSHLGRSVLAEPVFLLFTCRSGERDPEVEKAVDSIGRLRRSTAVELGPLRPAETSELLAHFLDELEPEELDGLAHRIHGITQGNPLFIVEILKFLHSEGLLHSKGSGRWQIDPVCLADTLPVPETVESAIKSRLEDLGQHGRVLAAHLGDLARPTEAEELRRRSGLDPFEVSEGIQQLFRLDLVRRTPEGRLEFLHDSITTVARRFLTLEIRRDSEGRPMGSKGRVRRALSVSALVLVVLSAVVLLMGSPYGRALFPILSRDHSQDYPFGQGSLLVRTVDGDYWVTAPERQGQPWSTGPAEVPFPQPVLHGPFRLPDGSLDWFARGADGPEYPPYVGIPRVDGSVQPLWKTEGDVGFEDLSPDGRALLLWEEDLETADYDRTLFLLNRDNMTTRTLFKGTGQLEHALWSPDGLRIVMVEPADPDPIIIINATGEILHRWAVPEAEQVGPASWCSDSEQVAFSALVDGRYRPGILRTSTGEHVLFPSYTAGSRVMCLGAGTGLAFAGGIGPDPQLLIQDLRDDAVFPVPGVSGLKITRFTWVPDRILPVVKGVRIAEGDVSVERGGRLELSAMGIFSDGVSRPVQVRWEALDPSVVSVDSVGVVTANMIGTALVEARYTTWITDTVNVTVARTDQPEVLFEEHFAGGSLSRWEDFGVPPSRLVQHGDSLHLSLEGDGRYRDGITSRESFGIGEGATIDLVFRLPLTRLDRQKIGICLVDANFPVGEGTESWYGQTLGDALCIDYPVGEGETRDPQALRVSYTRTGFTEVADLPEDFDTAAWTRLALQVRPDGIVSVFANRRFLRQLGFLVRVNREDSWKLLLYGASVDTEALVRSMTVWRGTRYPESPEGL